MSLIRTGVMLAATAGLSYPQNAAPATRPQFEVASVKPSAATPGSAPYTITDARIDIGFMPLKYLIQVAYRLETYQISGPDWMATTRFDISAKLPAGANKEQVPEMLQSLLEERFKLAAHHAAAPEQVYALAIGQGGPKLKDAAPDNQLDVSSLKGRRVLNRIAPAEGDGVWTISQDASVPNAARVFDAPRITMPEFARTLVQYLDYPVVDMTGLKGFYHVSLDVPRPARAGANAAQARAEAGVSPTAASDPLGDVSLFKSVQTLGLTLEKRTAPVDHLIVDRVEKIPTAN